MHPTPELLQIIRERGGKVTPQRLAIYEALQGNGTHPTAEAIFDRIRAAMPTVSLATVYKTLNELVALGELRRFDINGVSHFDERTDAHAEVVCLKCDTIVDVASPGTPPAPSIPGFEIIGQTQTFYGYCSHCRQIGAGGS